MRALTLLHFPFLMLSLSAVSVAEVPIYSELAALPGLVIRPQGFMNAPDASGAAKGLEFSSAVAFGGRLYATDDESKPIRIPGFGKDPKGLCLLEVSPGADARSFNLRRAWPESFMPLLNEGAKFDDMESTTARGGTLFLLGSHSFNKAGERKPQREVMLRIRQEGSGAPVIDFRETGLRDRMVEAIQRIEGSTLSAEEISATVNIEGMTVDPASQDLLIGLKSPLVGPESRAIVLRLKNPDAFFDGTAPQLEFSVEALLPTDSSGISSIEWDPVQKGFVIATNYKAWDYSGSGIWLWRRDPENIREICRFRERALEGVVRIPVGPLAGNLMLAFDEETIDQNWKTKDGGSFAIVSWGKTVR